MSDEDKPLPLGQLLNQRVLLAAGNYALLALVDISVRAIQPVFYSTPIELGGLGLAPHQIGQVFCVYGILNGVIQIRYFSKAHARLGPKNLHLAGVGAALIVFAMFPIISAMAKAYGINYWLVWVPVGIKILSTIFINFSYGKDIISITERLLAKGCLFAQAVSSCTSMHQHPTAPPSEQ